MDTICINDNYTQEWLEYFKQNGISYPKQDKLYTIRKIVQNTKGEKGLLLNEIINPEVTKISPLTGFKGSGKSTVSKYLQDNYNFEPINFKDSLVEEMKQRLPDVLEELVQSFNDLCPDFDTREPWTKDSLFNEKPPLMRALMSNYGTEVRRGDDTNYWVNKYLDKVKDKNRVVTDDVRFWNEYNTVKNNGGIIIRIERDDVTSGGTHQSETEQNDFIADFTIKGKAGSHIEIFKQIESIIDTIQTNID